jgi:hypothetical protein
MALSAVDQLNTISPRLNAHLDVAGFDQGRPIGALEDDRAASAHPNRYSNASSANQPPQFRLKPAPVSNKVVICASARLQHTKWNR